MKNLSLDSTFRQKAKILRKNLDVEFIDFLSFTGWVVTWFLLGYTVRMFEYTVRTF